MTRASARVATIAAAALVGACGTDRERSPAPTAQRDPTPVATEAPESGTPVVDMNDALQFAPEEITVPAGERVLWRNGGNFAHTVTTTPSKVADPKNVEVPRGAEHFDSGLIGEGESYERTFTEPGTYRYVCIPHEGAAMVGMVVVER